MRALAIGDGDFSFSSAIARVVISSWVDDDSDNHDNDNEDNRDAKNVAASSSDSAGEGRGRGCVVATSYEDADTLRDVYPDFDITLRHLMKSGGEVVVGYNVDATRLAETLPARARATSYHRICWNFPCTAIPSGKDGQNDAMERNKELIRKFVSSALPFLNERCGEIHRLTRRSPLTTSGC